MGDYTDRSSAAELDENSALSAKFTLPKHTVGTLPDANGGRNMSAADELQAMMDQDDEDSAQPVTTREKTGGRQKGTPNKVAKFDLQRACRLYGLRAVATFVEVMEDEESTNTERMAAAKEILDRGYGKAKQTTEITGVDGADIQTRLTIEFVGQPPINATVDARITDKAGEVIDMQLETVRVPEQRRPWDPA